MTAEEILAEIKTYIENTMARNRSLNGKFNSENWALWKLKKKLQELDPTVTNVGESFHEHEEANYDVQ